MLNNNFLNIFDHEYSHTPDFCIINATLQPEMKEAILSQSDHLIRRPLIYYDPDLHFLIGCGQSENAFNHIIYLMRQGGRLLDYRIRFTDQFRIFKETIHIFEAHRDDRLIALYKNLIADRYHARHPGAGKTIAFYTNEPEENIIVSSEHGQTETYPFSEAWYAAQQADSQLMQMLHYDTRNTITSAYLKRLMDRTLSAILVRLVTDQGQVDCVVNQNDHIHIGDQATFSDADSLQQGIAVKILSRPLKDIPAHTPFIRQVLPFENNSEKLSARHLEDILNQNVPLSVDFSQIFHLLEQCLLYVPMHEENDLLTFDTLDDTEDGYSFIPIFTSFKEVAEIYGDDYIIVRDRFISLVRQQIKPVNGYLLNPFSVHLLPIDQRMLKLFDELSSHSQSVN